MRTSYDVIVAGLGAMGSAAAYHLARRGKRVLGLDRFAPPHPWGSSHGKSRIIREAYWEHPLYVPFVQRAYECWEELERSGGRRLLVLTGGLVMGPPAAAKVSGSRDSALQYGLPYDELSAAEIRRRFPAFHPPDGAIGIWEPRAGFIIPEAAIAGHLEGAARDGAELRLEEPALSWEPVAGGFQVTTPAGRYTADRLVLAAGAWLRRLLPDLDPPLTVERTVLYWFRPVRNAARFAADAFPVFLSEDEEGRCWYGFPDTGDGIKVALHHQGEPADPDHLRREVLPAEVDRMRAVLRQLLPDADGELADTAACMYTNTPDHDFVVDTHPDHPGVVIASPCSGHGFKFSSAIGEVLADLAVEGHSRFDLSPFRLSRFQAAVRPRF